MKCTIFRFLKSHSEKDERSSCVCGSLKEQTSFLGFVSFSMGETNVVFSLWLRAVYRTEQRRFTGDKQNIFLLDAVVPHSIFGMVKVIKSGHAQSFNF